MGSQTLFMSPGGWPGAIYQTIYLSIYLSIYVSLYLTFYPSIYLSLYVPSYLNQDGIDRPSFLSKQSPLQGGPNLLGREYGPPDLAGLFGKSLQDLT